MKLDRRQLIRGALGLGAAAIILPPTLEENVELGRRIWALGAIPQGEQYLAFRYLEYPDSTYSACFRWDAVFTGQTINRDGLLVRVPVTRELIAVAHPYGGTLGMPIPSYATDNTVRRWR